MKTQRLTFIINFTLRRRLFNLDAPPNLPHLWIVRTPSPNCKRGGKELKITARLLNFQIRRLSITEGERKGEGKEGWGRKGGDRRTDAERRVLLLRCGQFYFIFFALLSFLKLVFLAGYLREAK